MQQRKSRTNFLVGVPGEYIYFQDRNRKYYAYKRYLEEPDNPLNKKFFNKCALFDTVEEAKEYLQSLPEVMKRPYRYDTLMKKSALEKI
jgi:hypothetical protein